MTAAANGEQQALVAGEVHRRDHVRHVDASRDQARPLVDHAVVERARGIVVGIARLNQSSAKILLKRCNPLFSHGALQGSGEILYPCESGWHLSGPTINDRRSHMSPLSLSKRLLLALSIVLATGVLPRAQATDTYKPEVGQPGKDVVWVPSPQALVDKMLDMAKVTPQDFVMDLGSGDGRTVITAAKRGVRAMGVEYNPDMVQLSRDAATGKASATGRPSCRPICSRPTCRRRPSSRCFCCRASTCS